MFAKLMEQQWQYNIMLRPTLASLSLPVSDTSFKKPIIIHHHNNLTMGGTEKMCQIFLKHFIKDLYL